MNDTSFAKSYSSAYTDNNSTVIAGTNEEGLRDAMHAETPGLPEWPWRAPTERHLERTQPPSQPLRRGVRP